MQARSLEFTQRPGQEPARRATRAAEPAPLRRFAPGARTLARWRHAVYLDGGQANNGAGNHLGRPPLVRVPVPIHPGDLSMAINSLRLLTPLAAFCLLMHADPARAQDLDGDTRQIRQVI